jgi:hypothetical protein
LCRRHMIWGNAEQCDLKSGGLQQINLIFSI